MKTLILVSMVTMVTAAVISASTFDAPNLQLQHRFKKFIHGVKQRIPSYPSYPAQPVIAVPASSQQLQTAAIPQILPSHPHYLEIKRQCWQHTMRPFYATIQGNIQPAHVDHYIGAPVEVGCGIGLASKYITTEADCQAICVNELGGSGEQVKTKLGNKSMPELCQHGCKNGFELRIVKSA